MSYTEEIKKYLDILHKYKKPIQQVSEKNTMFKLLKY